MAECSPEEYARALIDRSNFACLTRGDAIGLTVVVGAGLLSLVAILYVFLIIAHHVRWRLKHIPTARLQIFHQPMDVLMASLLIADIVQAIGAVLSLKWIKSGKVEVGPFCTSQGVIKIFGASGVALLTMAIAIDTFLGIWARKSIKSMKVALGVVMTIWFSIAALLILAVMLNRHPNFNFMGPAPYWCWVNRYEVGLGWKAAVEYLWLMLTPAISLLIYIPLYLWMRGNLVIDENVWWKFYFKRSTDADPESRDGRSRRRQSLTMLAYPAVNCLCILPMSAARWKTWVQGNKSVSSAFTLFAVSIFGLSGFFNAILLLKTRPASGLFGQLMFRAPARPPSVHSGDDVEQRGGGLGKIPS